MQPSFLCFYLFLPQQHNASFLLTSEGEIEYTGGSFSKQPQSFTLSTAFFTTLGLSSFSFSTLMRVFNLFIYLGDYISPSSPFKTKSVNSPVHTTRCGKILHTYSLISPPLFPKRSHLLPNRKNSPPHFKGTFKTSLATNQYFK